MQLFLGIFLERIHKIHIGKQFKRTIFRGVVSNVSTWENNFIHGLINSPCQRVFFIRKAESAKTLFPRQDCHASATPAWIAFGTTLFSNIWDQRLLSDFEARNVLKTEDPPITRVLLRHHHLWLWHELSITKWQHQRNTCYKKWCNNNFHWREYIYINKGPQFHSEKMPLKNV